jgi:transposase
MTKKTRPTYTDEQKDEVKRLIQEGVIQNKITEMTGVGKGTVVKIAAELKGNSTKKLPTQKASSSLDLFKVELKAIQHRKQEVEELLHGKLKDELDALTLKEKAIQDLLSLYSK